MNIILEGIDNSGKTTLAQIIAKEIGYPIRSSEGPPKHAGEMEKRIERYLQMDNTIFDRHPAISNPLYDEAFQRTPDRFDGVLIDRLYASRPLIIYCDPCDRQLRGYQSNPRTESAEHLANLDRNYDKLLSLYRAWAVTKANFLYRVGDDVPALLDAVIGVWTARLVDANGLRQPAAAADAQ